MHGRDVDKNAEREHAGGRHLEGYLGQQAGAGDEGRSHRRTAERVVQHELSALGEEVQHDVHVGLLVVGRQQVAEAVDHQRGGYVGKHQAQGKELAEAGQLGEVVHEKQLQRRAQLGEGELGVCGEAGADAVQCGVQQNVGLVSCLGE